MNMVVSFLGLAIAWSTIVGPAIASTMNVSINPFSSSHCIQSSQRCFGYSNNGASILNGGAAGIRHFMVFDLSGVQGSLLSAELNIAEGEGGYWSFTDTKIYKVTEISPDLPNLTSRATGADATVIYNAIGAGDLLGSTEVATPGFSENPMPAVSVSLADGLSGIESAFGNEYAIGGQIGGGGQLFDFNFGRSGASAVSLDLVVDQSSPSPVPLPGSGALLFGCLGALGWFRRNRRN